MAVAVATSVYSRGAMKAIPATPAVLAALLACTFDPPINNSFGSGPVDLDSTAQPDTTTGDSTTTTAPPASTSSSEPDTSDTTSTGSLPDLGTMPDLGPLLPEGCYGKKIDFLFVIGNSISMEFAQETLLAAFPAFMDAIEARNIDKHILVTTTYPTWLMKDCTECVDDCDKHGIPPICGADITKCDITVGAGFTHPRGEGASNRRCELAGGNRYITDEEPDLDAAFECLATVGIGGGSTNEIKTVLPAISPELNAPGACNDGFLRDDALLVITTIEEHPNWASMTDAEDQIEQLLLAKHNDPDAIYLLAITSDLDQPHHLCEPETDEYYEDMFHMRLLTQMLPHASTESICVDDFAPYFESALTTILELCDSFVPPQ